jgi:hypothetical protein
MILDLSDALPEPVSALDRGAEIARRLQNTTAAPAEDLSIFLFSLPSPLVLLLSLTAGYWVSEVTFREIILRQWRFFAPEHCANFFEGRRSTFTGEFRAYNLNYSHWAPSYRLRKSLQFRDKDGAPLRGRYKDFELKDWFFSPENLLKVAKHRTNTPEEAQKLFDSAMVFRAKQSWWDVLFGEQHL